MPLFRVVFGTPGGRIEHVFEARSRSVAEQASRACCLKGCRVLSVEPSAEAEPPEAPAPVPSGGVPGPRRPPPLTEHAYPVTVA